MKCACVYYLNYKYILPASSLFFFFISIKKIKINKEEKHLGMMLLMYVMLMFCELCSRREVFNSDGMSTYLTMCYAQVKNMYFYLHTYTVASLYVLEFLFTFRFCIQQRVQSCLLFLCTCGTYSSSSNQQYNKKQYSKIYDRK